MPEKDLADAVQSQILNDNPTLRTGLAHENKFEKRIQWLFGATVITAAIYALTAVSFFISLKQNWTNLVDKQIQNLLLVKDLEISMDKAYTSARAFAISGDQRFLLRAKQDQLQTGEMLKQFVKLNQDANLNHIVTRALKSLDRNISDAKEIISLRESGKSTADSITYFEEKITPERRMVRTIIKEFEDYANQQYKAGEARVRETWQRSLWLFVIAAILSIILFWGLMWANTRSLSQQRRAEKSLALIEMISKQAVDLAGLGLFYHDHICNDLFWSPKLKEMFLFESKKIPTISDYLSLIPEEDKASIAEKIKEAHVPTKSGVFEAVHPIIRPDGSERWVMLKSQTYFEGSGSKIHSARTIGAVLDITNAKEVETSLRQALESLAKEKIKLERSNNELEQFASIAAHDLRAPINSIIGWVGVLEKSIPKPRDQKFDKAIEFITYNMKKADTLIGDLLEVARLNDSNISYEDVDLNSILNDLLTVMKEPFEAAKAHIRVGKLPIVKGCPSYFQSLFSNLIQNAILYRDKTRDPKISIGCQKKFGFYEFIVSDNGFGIDPQYVDRIFEMFTRLHNDREHPGTGIGLAYCKKVVELYGGNIWVNSKLGEGSTFHFTYPINIIKGENA